MPSGGFPRLTWVDVVRRSRSWTVLLWKAICGREVRLTSFSEGGFAVPKQSLLFVLFPARLSEVD